MASRTTRNVNMALYNLSQFFLRLATPKFFFLGGGGESRGLPQEKSESDSSLIRSTEGVTVASRGPNHNSQGDGPSKPENHRNGLKREGCEFVEDAGHVERGEANIGENEE